MIDLAAIQRALDDDTFGERGWITFYLRGPPDRLALMRAGLADLDAVNLEGAETGFVYAKVPVALSNSEITERVSHVRDLAVDAGIEIDIIDLDASSKVARSKFYTLWTAP